MKAKLIILLLPILSIQCVTYYTYFQIKSDFYTKEEIRILEKTTSALNYGHGYDSEMQLEYVFKNPKGTQSSNRIKNEVAGINRKKFVRFYEKVYRLKILTRLKRDKFQEQENWKYYTYINKYLLPDLDSFFNEIEQELRSKDPGYYAKRSRKQRLLNYLVEEELLRTEMESEEYKYSELRWENSE